MTNLSIKVLVILLFASVITSCSKYEEGPAFSLRTKTERISNEWIVEKATDIVEGTDITEDYTGEIWDFRKDGTFFKNGELKGNWDFYNDKEAVIITKDNGDSDVFRILKLKEKEMWLEITGEEELIFVPF